MGNLSAFHVLWGAPAGKRGIPFKLSQAELLTLVLSALLWRKSNGSIKLYTDRLGYEYIVSQNIEWIYDEGIDTETLVKHGYEINPEIFWAAGKILALHAHQAPCVMLDHDLIVVKPIHELIGDNEVLALHPEELNPDIYLKPELLKRADGYEFPKQFNWYLKPLNTAFLFVKNEDFKQSYTGHALDFMNKNREYPKEMVSQMVFAEQRMLAMTAALYNQKTGWLLNNPFELSNRHIIHLWGFKQELRRDPLKEELFINRLLDTFRSELTTFNEFENFLNTYYFKDYALSIM